jgi:SAM-dependent methyltransferase
MERHALEGCLDVLVGLGLVEATGDKFAALPGFAELLRGPSAVMLKADLRSSLGQMTAIVEDAREAERPLEGWHASDPVVVEAQAIISELVQNRMQQMFLSHLEGLDERLSAPGAAVLDVGSGGAGVCIALARWRPGLRIVGLEPAADAMAIGRRRVAESGVGDRIELRPLRIEQLTDVAAFDFAYVASMFMPDEALEKGLPAVLRALKPGGWLVTGASCIPGTDLASAASRFKTATWGGGRRFAPDLVAALERACFAQVMTPPAPGSGLAPVLARKAEG